MKIWQSIENTLQTGNAAALLLVVENSSNSPGRQGFAMTVSSSGSLVGTIGGGPMEYRLVAYAQEQLLAQSNKVELLPQVHRRDDAHSSGMICRGQQLVALFPCYGEHLACVQEIRKRKERFAEGSWCLSPDGLSIWDSNLVGRHKKFEQYNDSPWSYQENFAPAFRLFIIGSGHVGLALSRIAATLDFQVTAVDNRPEVQTFKENNFVDTRITSPYQELTHLIPDSDSSFVVVVTTNAKTDEIALRALLGKKLGYLGVMGSKAKIDFLFGSLREAGATEQDIARIHAPIGAAIASHTAEEIAVSIAAELIHEKNKRQF